MSEVKPIKMLSKSSRIERLYSDDDLIEGEITLCEDMESLISSACARMIASQYHSGQASDLYSFASTGFISDTLLDTINREFEAIEEVPPGRSPERHKLSHLAMYVAERKSRGDVAAVEGWSNLWLEAPNEADLLCHCCFEHISSPHAVGCPLGVDDEELLERVQQLQDESGVHVLHWLSYVGFRNLDELNQAADKFAEHYHGFYDSVLDYAQEIAANLDNPPRIEELVAQINRTMHVAEGLYGGVYIYDK